ncbi:MAG TPA: histidine kinase [Acidimicrobiales bacterium]|nr:histidine kinase [Acidimicrobiales bacterium]
MIEFRTAAAAPGVPFLERLATLIRHLPRRVHEQQFWVVQAGVLGATATHTAAELWAAHADLDVPSALHHLPAILFLAPISYASLSYGMEGAVLTGLWSAVLTVPNLVIWHREDYGWLELLYVATVVLAGVVTSVPVERERQQRHRAEATSQRLALLDDIATLTSTGGLQPTLDEALRRLHEMLGLAAVWVAVSDQAAAGASPTVLARHPAGGGAAAPPEWLDQARPPPAHVVVVPLRAKLPGSGPHDRVDGVLAAELDPTRSLTTDDRRLLEGVANHLAVAIANESLAAAERNRVRSYVKLVTEALEDERKRIARELHDEAAQNVVVIRRSLAALRTTLDDHPAAAELGELAELAGQTIAGIRRSSRDLRPPTLDELGVASALDQLVSQVRERCTFAARLRVSGQPRRLPTETELAVFRIGQAAIHNVERHAGAANLDVALTFEPDGLRLEVVDDGCGFEPAPDVAALPEAGKLGLMGMHERAHLVGGSLEIRSGPGAGTRVVLCVPDAT